MKVITYQLSPDCTTAEASFGLRDCGELDTKAIGALLEKFTGVDAAQNHLHDPHVVVQARDEKYLIRTSLGRLHLYNARDTSQPGVEVTLPALLAVFDGIADRVAQPAAAEPEPLLSRPPPKRSRLPLGVALLAVGLGLNAWGLHQFLDQPVDPAPPVPTVITDPKVLDFLRQTLSGTYATGSAAGSRVITIGTDGTIKFHLLARGATPGETKAVRQTADTYNFGRRPGGGICLATGRHGQILAGADGSLFHYGDVYRPAK